ncbi:hypothetical protein F8388_018641 [Cannabis sativa]|uniref:NADH:quinone oxidoreductase/Mrp antiporter transmembrane domain-containing protein n=1 Tax=Cannabis sativa TaxID=3483 RepID=A0A7J6FCV0_CANSA|nr:hypothetical protein F8388_018641 [Cannabis sativa]
MKRMLAYSSIGQIGYVIIGIIVGDSNGGYASMITYMLFYIFMNLGTFACIVLFGLRTRTDNIRDYAGLYTKDIPNSLINTFFVHIESSSSSSFYLSSMIQLHTIGHQ